MAETTHAPDGPDGASPANLQRAEKTRQLLTCVGGVDPAVATRITTPYQLHHGDADVVVPLAKDQALARVLMDSGTSSALHVDAGRGHSDLAHDPLVLSRIQFWYRAHGVLRD